MDLPEFLLARIAEDEEWARAAAKFHPTPWRLDPEVQTTMEVGRWLADARDEGVLVANGDAAAKHIARHDPARVLAECAAKRAMIQAWPDPMGQWNAAEADAARAMKRQVLLAWARVHADHPDFDPAWR